MASFEKEESKMAAMCVAETEVLRSENSESAKRVAQYHINFFSMLHELEYFNETSSVLVNVAHRAVIYKQVAHETNHFMRIFSRSCVGASTEDN